MCSVKFPSESKEVRRLSGDISGSEKSEGRGRDCDTEVARVKFLSRSKEVGRLSGDVSERGGGGGVDCDTEVVIRSGSHNDKDGNGGDDECAFLQRGFIARQ